MAPRESYGRCVRRIDVGGTLVRDTRLASGAILPRHEHGAAYVCVVLDGHYTEWSHAETRCAVGSVLVHPAGHVHENLIGRGGARCVNLELDDYTLRDGPLRAIASLLDGERHLALTPMLPVLRRFAEALGCDGDADTGSKVDPLAALEVHAATLDLLCALTRIAPTRAPTLARAAGRTATLSRVIDCLEADLASPPSIDTLAALAGLHPHHFMRVFRTHQAETVGAYVRRRRLEDADAALRDPRDGRTLADIALDAGFCDQSHFTRAFRRQFGTTPARRRRAR